MERDPTIDWETETPFSNIPERGTQISGEQTETDSRNLQWNSVDSPIRIRSSKETASSIERWNEGSSMF